jgi:hypothetical protein
MNAGVLRSVTGRHASISYRATSEGSKRIEYQRWLAEFLASISDDGESDDDEYSDFDSE